MKNMGYSQLKSEDVGPSTPASTKPTKTIIQQAQEQVNETTGILRENLKKIFERDTKITDLTSRATDLEQGAAQFEKQGKKLERKYWYKDKRMKIIMAVVGILLVIIIGAFILF